MRFLVFLLGLFGSLATGFFGWIWLLPANSQGIAQLAEDYGYKMPDLIVPNFDFEPTTWAGVFLVVGGALGLLGSLFTLLRRGRHGGVLMLLACIGPAIFNPVTAMFSGLLGFAGLLSLFIGPLPPAVEPVE
jgi:hypothetical protein